MNPISLGGEGVGKQGKGGMKERKGKGECTHSKNMYCTEDIWNIMYEGN